MSLLSGLGPLTVADIRLAALHGSGSDLLQWVWDHARDIVADPVTVHIASDRDDIGLVMELWQEGFLVFDYFSRKVVVVVVVMVGVGVRVGVASRFVSSVRHIAAANIYLAQELLAHFLHCPPGASAV